MYLIIAYIKNLYCVKNKMSNATKTKEAEANVTTVS